VTYALNIDSSHRLETQVFASNCPMSKHIKSYFELHAHEYSRDPRVYDSLAEEIKRAKPNQHTFSVLDMGCGKGNFIKAMIERGLKAHYIGTDISIRMIELAKNNLQSTDVDLLAADGFKVPIKPTLTFDVIHIDSLLHHLVGPSRAKSFCLVKELIEKLISVLSPHGMLIVEEMYYDSYLIPQLTSFIIFYTLKA
jgi:SAM-dependent methyltransferase